MAWMFMAFHWGSFLLWDYCKPENIWVETSSNSTAVTSAPVLIWDHTQVTFYQIIEWLHILLFLPLWCTISLSIYTNLLSYEAGELWKRVAIIYSSHLMLSIPYFFMTKFTHWINAFAVLGRYVLWYSMVFIVWYFLSRFLKLKWSINVYLLPLLWMCWHIVMMIFYLPTLLERNILKDTLVYVPLMTMTIEFIFSNELHYMFKEHGDNTFGLALSIAYSLYLLELLRSICFVLLWFGGSDAQIEDKALNVLFSIIGELYTHTSIWHSCNNEIEMRFWERRVDEFKIIMHDSFSSIRTVVEYLVPVVVAANILLLSYFSDRFQGIGEVVSVEYLKANNRVKDEIWNILGVYYFVEFISEALCWAINKLSSYQRVSIIGNLNCSKLFFMPVYCSAMVNMWVVVAGFLIALNQS